MFVSGVETAMVRRFGEPMVASARPILPAQVDLAREIGGLSALSQGALIDVGSVVEIEIADPTKPDFGDPPDIRPGDELAFKARRAVPQIAPRRAKTPVAFTQEPGCMFAADLGRGRPGFGAAARPREAPTTSSRLSLDRAVFSLYQDDAVAQIRFPVEADAGAERPWSAPGAPLERPWSAPGAPLERPLAPLERRSPGQAPTNGAPARPIRARTNSGRASTIGQTRRRFWS